MPRIFVFDEDEERLKSVSDYLLAQGFSVFSCRSATEAFRRLKWDRFDLVLADLHRQRKTGLWLLRSIRDQAEIGLPDIPVLLWGPTQAGSGDEMRRLNAHWLERGTEHNDKVLLQWVNQMLAPAKAVAS